MPAKGRPNIRRAVRDDLPAIVRIEKSSFGRNAWERDAFLDYLSEPEKCIFLVAIRDEAIISYALGVHNKTRAEMDSVAVAPSHRGRGVASALLNRLIAIFRRRGVISISLM